LKIGEQATSLAIPRAVHDADHMNIHTARGVMFEASSLFGVGDVTGSA
jgi:hypothetical protein